VPSKTTPVDPPVEELPVPDSAALIAEATAALTASTETDKLLKEPTAAPTPSVVSDAATTDVTLLSFGQASAAAATAAAAAAAPAPSPAVVDPLKIQLEAARADADSLRAQNTVLADRTRTMETRFAALSRDNAVLAKTLTHTVQRVKEMTGEKIEELRRSGPAPAVLAFSRGAAAAATTAAAAAAAAEPAAKRPRAEEVPAPTYADISVHRGVGNGHNGAAVETLRLDIPGY